MSSSTLTGDDIIKLIDNNDWSSIYEALVNDKIRDPNEILINGNNLFHIACIRTQTEFVENVYKLCYPDTDTRKCALNTELHNEEGQPGIHLYYRYGGKSKKLLRMSSVCYLDRDYRGLIDYLIGSIDLLEVFIDSTIKRACLPNIELVGPTIKIKRNIYFMLIKQIQKLEESHSKSISKLNSKSKSIRKGNKSGEISRYLEIIKLLMLNLTNKKAAHYAIYMDSSTVLDYLIDEKLVNPFIKNTRNETPLILAIRMGKLKTVEQLLKAYEDIKADDLEEVNIDVHKHPMVEIITQYRIFSDDRPINICIQMKRYDILELLIEYLKKYRAMSGDKSYHTETDSYNSTYLHNLLQIINTTDKGDRVGKENKKKQKLPVSLPILKYLIDYTDLNQMNYFGYSSAHLIFIGGLWKNKEVQTILKGRKIDLLKTDPNNQNIYSYVKDKDKKEFMEFTKSIVLEMNTYNTLNGKETDREIKETEQIIDVINRDRLLAKKEYGLFHPTQINYMLFMLYLKNKHSNLFIPHRVYDSDKQRNDQYIMDITNYPLSDIQSVMNEIELMDHVKYYSYTPHLIDWYDSNIYYINPELVQILKAQNKADSELKRRFVMFKILIILSETANHANCLVYDRKKKEAWRFESYGLSDLARDGLRMDSILKSILESVYGEITYHGPSEYLANIKFQLVDDEDDIRARNLGDPGGYCLAWCIWFIDIICSNLDKAEKMTVDYLMRHYITRERLEGMFDTTAEVSTTDKLDKSEGLETETESDTTPKTKEKKNLYLEYIRQYGHFLDAEKNLILHQIGVDKSDFYAMVASSSSLEKIIEKMKVDKVEYS